MTRRCILTIEDDPAIRRGIVDALEYAGYTVLQTGDGIDGGSSGSPPPVRPAAARTWCCPARAVWRSCSWCGRSRPTLPVIILTARGDEQDRVAGLRQGADDYVVKPFSVKELLARVEAVLRRTPERPADIEHVAVPGGCADLARCEVRFDDGERVELSEKEIELLRYLVRHSGRAISRDELLGNVWRISPQGVSTRTIDMHIARLREKLRDDPATPRTLLTVRGKGYMFAAPGPTADPAAQ